MQPERDALIGRTEDVAELVEVLAPRGQGWQPPLVTLTGPGGVGKTRLAHRLALRLEGEVPVAFAELRGLEAPATAGGVAERIAVAAGAMSVSDAAEGLDWLARVLCDRSMLLVLDNAEPAVDAVADVVGELLEHCPHLRVLVTSRAALDIPGEQQYPVAPLSAPLPTSDEWQPDTVPDAVALFRERARHVDPTFTLSTSQQRAAVARICHRLGG